VQREVAAQEVVGNETGVNDAPFPSKEFRVPPWGRQDVVYQTFTKEECVLKRVNHTGLIV